jgi:hypothetical protein
MAHEKKCRLSAAANKRRREAPERRRQQKIRAAEHKRIIEKLEFKEKVHRRA